MNLAGTIQAIDEIQNRVTRFFSIAYEELTGNIDQRAFLDINIRGSNATLVASLLPNSRIVVEAGYFNTLIMPKIIGVNE